MYLQTTQDLIGIAGLLFVGGGSLVGTTIFIMSQIRNSEEKIRLILEKRDVENSRARHDAKNDMVIPINRLESRLDRLEREAVHKDDMQELEKRFTSTLGELKISVDKFSDKMGSLLVIERDLKYLSVQVERLLPKNRDD